ARAAAIASDNAPECLWFLQHPSLYTAGTSAKPEELLAPNKFPIYKAGRGGAYTYHGPGQRVVYVMLDLRKQKRDVRAFVHKIEQWVIASLATFNVQAHTTEGRIGIWVDNPSKGIGRADKIGAIGLRVRRWVSFHGLAINVDMDLENFNGIIPCGIADQDVTQLKDLHPNASIAALDDALLVQFKTLFKLHHDVINREFIVNPA
ncbi:MAG: lipoyl(octanoyl) transferase LipB, partial [Alphaproteobacteria bacterium]|nr:lipoyl(octanoyl) transferase LipB [Alphaproteobacteria bacterium]